MRLYPLVSSHELRRRFRVAIPVYAAWIVAYEVVARMALRLPAHNIATSIDTLIPLQPAWVWIYELTYVMPIAALFIINDARRFDRAVWAIAIASIAAFVVYVAFPVTFPRPSLGHGLAEHVLAMEYHYDSNSNHLPSLHVANVFILYFAIRGPRLGRWGNHAALVIALLVSASTVLVKQHLVADVITGALLGWLAHLVALRIIPGSEQTHVRA